VIPSRRVRLLAATLPAGLVVLPGAAGGADLPAAPARPPVIVLAGQSPWVAPDGGAALQLEVDSDAKGLAVTVSVFRAVSSRGQLTRALAGKGLGVAEGRHSVPLDSLPLDGTGNRVLSVGVKGQVAPPAPERIVPGDSGVYPLLVELHRPTGQVMGSFVTPLAVVAGGLVPLTLTWVWRLDVTPGRDPEGHLRTGAARALAPEGRMARLITALERAPDIPVTLAPTPETLETWLEVAAREGSAERAVLDRLRAEAARPNRQVLGGPYVPVDMPALLAAGMTSEVDAQFQRGSEALAAGLGAPPSPTTLLARSLDASALGRLTQRGVERLVVPPSDLEPLDQRLTPGRPFTVTGRGRHLAGAVTDPGLAELLEGNDPPALRAARFLGGLTLVALEAPRDPRGVVVVAPEGWNPPSELLESVFAGLRGHPAVTSVTLDGFFAIQPPETREGVPVTRTLRSGSGREAPVDAGAVRSARRRLAAFADLVGESDPVRRLAERAVLMSQLLPPAQTPARPSARTWLSGSDRLVNGVTGRVHGPQGRLTLTARRGGIPISLLNANPRALQVRVSLESDQLRFPEGSERVLTLPPRNTTSSFAVEARSPGAFPLVITVTSPNGQLLVARSRLTIRSTVVSGVGALLTGGAGAFLLAWWGNDLRRARRRARQEGRRQATRRRLARRRRRRMAPPRPVVPVEAKHP
jgi:uncharacterized protein DUF6049